MKVAILLAKNVLAPLGITAAASAVQEFKKKNKNTWFWNNNYNNFSLILQQTLKYKNIIKLNQDLMVFFQEIIYLKK